MHAGMEASCKNGINHTTPLSCGAPDPYQISLSHIMLFWNCVAVWDTTSLCSLYIPAGFTTPCKHIQKWHFHSVRSVHVQTQGMLGYAALWIKSLTFCWVCILFLITIFKLSTTFIPGICPQHPNSVHNFKKNTFTQQWIPVLLQVLLAQSESFICLYTLCIINNFYIKKKTQIAPNYFSGS